MNFRGHGSLNTRSWTEHHHHLEAVDDNLEGTIDTNTRPFVYNDSNSALGLSKIFCLFLLFTLLFASLCGSLVDNLDCRHLHEKQVESFEEIPNRKQ